AENAEIDPRVEPEQAPLDAGLPVLGEKIAQALTAHDSGGRRGAGDTNFSPSGNLRPMPRFRWAESRVNENCGEKGPVPPESARYPRAKADSFVILSPWRGAELFLLAGAIYLPAVVPAKAGTHNPR